MDFVLILRVVFVFAMTYSVYSFPAKGSYGQVHLQNEMNPAFDPYFNDWVQESIGPMSGSPSLMPTNLQQQGPSPPGASGMHPYSSQEEFQMTPSAVAKGSVPQTSSGSKDFQSAYTGVVSDLSWEPEIAEEPKVLPRPVMLGPPEPVYKAGTVISQYSAFENGREESEFHDSGDLIHPVQFRSMNVAPKASADESFPQVDFDDTFFQMFITGQIPSGTITHFRSDYDYGSNAWTDIGFERITPVKRAPVTQSKIQSVSKKVHWDFPRVRFVK